MRAVLFFVLTFSLSAVYGQTIHIAHKSRDNTYIKDFYHHHLIIRAYESSKFNNFKLVDSKERLMYKPDHHNNLGLGFSYKVVSVNFEFNIPFFDQNNEKYGITHAFDVQTYVYIHRFVIDFYGQYYNGYYLANANDALVGNQLGTVKRPDISTKDISIICQYVFNDRRFSFNAPFYQNEIQEKSAGSFLAGGGIYHNDGSADSSFIPPAVTDPGFFQHYRFNGFSYTGIGVNVGYAYTLVIKKHFFITGSLTAGAGIGHAFVSDRYQSKQNDMGTGMEYMVNGKYAAGYTNDKYFAGVTYVRLVTEINSVVPRCWEQESTGNFRFTIAKRLGLKKPIAIQSDLIKID